MRGLFLLLVFCCAGFVPAARAQVLDIDQIPDIPRWTTLSDEDFVAGTKLYEERPYGDPQLAYEIRLPTDWIQQETLDEQPAAPEQEKDNDFLDRLYVGEPETEEPVAPELNLNRRILAEIGRYYGPANLGLRSRVEIGAQELDYDITARNWFVNYVLTNGFTLQGVDVISDSRVEGLYVRIERDVTYVVRVVAEINGQKLVMVSYYMPLEYWEKEKQWQEKIIDSFRLKRTEKVQIETLDTYFFLDYVSFDYPLSWKPEPMQIYALDDMAVRLVRTDGLGAITGDISVHFFDKDAEGKSLSEEVALLKEVPAKRGLKLGKLIEARPDYTFDETISFGQVEVYGTEGSAERTVTYEYWVAVLADDERYYLVTMLTVGRNADFYPWARNIEAFEVALRTLREQT
ncbi:MAG: hypothetical protein KDJ15_03965 [Alphaproteobacteria bacterium]|nr:hypothetical protein [Alphaproteobacteria bacterium]